MKNPYGFFQPCDTGIIDHSYAEQTLGAEKTSHEDVVKETSAWYRQLIAANSL